MQKPFTIEIHGTGTNNRGAELMAIAIAERMRATFPGVRMVVPPNFGNFEDRLRYGFYMTDEFGGRFRSKLYAKFAPLSIRRSAGMIAPAEVDAVLDASGFAFSDQWGPENAAFLLRKMLNPARRNQPLILLPQALGPFSNPQVADRSRKLFSHAKMVCARDQKSFEAATQLGGESPILKYPDFTIGVAPVFPEGAELPPRFGAIVPNIRMLDRTDSGDAYIAFLQQTLSLLLQNGFNPGFVLHDAYEDLQVVKKLGRSVKCPVMTDSDPRVLKGILGRADLVVGSRYHALVGALSQGVPCIGAGWSHKYSELFFDFDSGDLLISDLADKKKLEITIAELADKQHRSIRIERITQAAQVLKKLSAKMWQEVEGLLRDSINPHVSGRPLN